MQVVIDILENELIEKYPDVLGILLCDQTTQKNIFWATDNYEHLGESYKFNSEIIPELITGEKGNVIMPRVHKDKILQLSRSKEMAEVFTPSWICNAQNNLVDNSWFEREDVFNKEIVLKNGVKSWKTTKEKIVFPKGKTWQDYVCDTRLEISCGEAPYLVSRYDTTTGEFISIENRIGLLDRKLRVVNDNLDSITEWLKAVETAYKSTYGFEWQGDSLLLAREALLITFIENFTHKFEIEP
ncbi:MAG TPA: restriction endonuclease subunit M, partial [Flavobacterium alvei]|nr:restriction endonuclease subunit M [Flavobacterium alvei]